MHIASKPHGGYEFSLKYLVNIVARIRSRIPLNDSDVKHVERINKNCDIIDHGGFTDLI
jgi:hypothetical protein